MSLEFVWFLSLIAARTAVVLFLLVGGLRLLGKRQLGQMNVYDLSMVMGVANAVQNAMTHGSGKLAVGMVSAGTLLLIGFGLSYLFVRLPKLEERLAGMPTLLISNGRILKERLAREHVTEAELMAVLRQHGLASPADVRMAVLEVDGVISVVPTKRARSG